MTKAEMRRAMRRRRGAVAARAEKDARICDLIAALPEFAACRCLLAYAAVGSEVSLKHLLERAKALGKTVCLPVCGENGAMEAAALGGELTPGRFGIPEPRGALVPPEALDLVLVPGLAFDRDGGRLGQGGGYYDRYLTRTRALRLGVAYADCIVPAVPRETHDLLMDALVCEAGHIRIGGRKRV